MDFDLSFRGFEVRNSWLQRRYLLQSVATLGAAVVKKWAKETEISDSRSGYLSSYADVVMWIHLCFLDAFVAEVTRVVKGVLVAPTDIFNHYVITDEPEGTHIMLTT